MTQISQDLLLELCKPYLMDLLTVLAKSLRYPEEPIHEVVEGEHYLVPSDTLHEINDLNEKQITKVLCEITAWMESGCDRGNSSLTNNDHEQTN